MACPSPIRLGISRCLLGDSVRYDGGHKRNAYLADTMSREVEWVPICPEVEAGLGTPREPLQLIGPANRPTLVTITTRQDKTPALKKLSIRRLCELKSLHLCGYVLKARSPSCGISDVPLHDRQGRTINYGTGIFAATIRRHFSLIPLTDEGCLIDPPARTLFFQRVFGYHRLQLLLRSPVTRQAVTLFHHAETPLLLKHSRKHYLMLTALISRADRHRPKDLARRYAAGFMDALAAHPSLHTSPRRRKNLHADHATKADQ